MPQRPSCPMPSSSGYRCRSPEASVPVFRPAPGWTTITGGFVDHQNVRVLPTHFEGNVFGHGPASSGGLGKVDRSARDPVVGVDRAAIDVDAFFEQASGLLPGDAGQLGDDLVGSLAGQVVRDGLFKPGCHSLPIGIACSVIRGDGFDDDGARPPRADQEDGDRHRDGRVGHVEGREVGELHPVDHVAVEETLTAGEAIDQIAQGATDDHAEGDDFVDGPRLGQTRLR